MKLFDFTMRERAIYRNIEEMLKKQHGENHGLIISPGYLRSEQILTNQKGKYTFDLKKNGGEVATELKLDRNDLFVVTAIGMYITTQVIATLGKEVLQTYPNETAFTSAGVTPNHLETIYNGYTSLKIANRVNIENLSNQVFRYVPDTQQAAATTKSTQSWIDAAYKPAQIIQLHGTMDITWTVEFPTFAAMAMATADATVSTNKMVLIPYGFIIKGGADKK